MYTIQRKYHGTNHTRMLTIELDYENSKEKLIKSFNKKIPGKKFFPGIYTWRVFQNLISLYCQEGSISIRND